MPKVRVGHSLNANIFSSFNFIPTAPLTSKLTILFDCNLAPLVMRNGNTNQNNRNFNGNFSQQQQQQQRITLAQQQQQSNYWPSQVPGQHNLNQPQERRLNANDLWKEPLQPGHNMQARVNSNLWNSESSSMQTSVMNDASSRNIPHGRSFNRMPPASFPVHGGSNAVSHQQNMIPISQNSEHERERGHQQSVSKNDLNAALGISLANNSNNFNAQGGKFSGNDVSSQGHSELAPSVAALFKAFESSSDSRNAGNQQMFGEQQMQQQQQHQMRQQQQRNYQQRQQHNYQQRQQQFRSQQVPFQQQQHYQQNHPQQQEINQTRLLPHGQQRQLQPQIIGQSNLNFNTQGNLNKIINYSMNTKEHFNQQSNHAPGQNINRAPVSELGGVRNEQVRDINESNRMQQLQHQNGHDNMKSESIERRQRSILSLVGIDLSLSPENSPEVKQVKNNFDPRGSNNTIAPTSYGLGNPDTTPHKPTKNTETPETRNLMSISLASARDDELLIIKNSPALKRNIHGRGSMEKTTLADWCSLKIEPLNAGPEDKVTITWEMPKCLIARGDWIGIYRIHQKTFQSCMTSRYVYTTSRGNRHVKREFEHENYVMFEGEELALAGGTLVFHAPPAIGRYDFRLFQQRDADKRDIQALQQESKNKKAGRKGRERDHKKDDGDNNDSEDYALPIARSPVLTVESQGRAFISSLKFLRKRIEPSLGIMKKNEGKKKIHIPREYLGSLNQLVRLFEQVRDDGPGAYIDAQTGKEKPKLEFVTDLWPVISMCVSESLKIPKPKTRVASGDNLEETNFDKEDRDIFSLHKTTRDVLLLSKLNPTIWRLLEDDEKFQLNKWYDNYWHEKVSNLINAYDESYDVGGAYGKMYPAAVNDERIKCISSTIEIESPKLMSTHKTEQARLELRNRLEGILNDLPYKNIKLGIFGSSMNNFGSPKSDLDMCLQIPADVIDEVDQRQIIEQLADILPKYGMIDIDTARITARIPIIQFVDGKTGIECDVCVNNTLALRNTRLLRAYSYADVRVRQVAYIIKKWSKCRKINDPSKSTLSSYGYILTLIQSLQHGGWVSGNTSRFSSHKPLLPFLQQIDETWDPINDSASDPKLLPKVMVPTLSGDTVDSYFYDATRDGAKKVQLQTFASKCTCPVGKLLLEYFWYYGFVFQWRRQVVSIRKESVVLKHEKARDYGWKRNGQLSIADPFEIGYNVAHVLRPNTNKRLRDEFVRAYCILAGMGQQDVSAESALSRLFEEYIEPIEDDEEGQGGDPKDDTGDKNADVGKKQEMGHTKKAHTDTKDTKRSRATQKKNRWNKKSSRGKKKNRD